jgi:transcriptional regulator with XRE-family HTH domain
VAEDWSAVAKAINQRAAELGLRQRDLVKRSNVSRAVVSEIQHNRVQRRRSARTLEALSVALDLHPEHLLAVLLGRRPPAIGEPVYRIDEDYLPARLADIEHQLREIAERLNALSGINERLDEMTASLAAVIGTRRPDRSRGIG